MVDALRVRTSELLVSVVVDTRSQRLVTNIGDVGVRTTRQGIYAMVVGPDARRASASRSCLRRHDDCTKEKNKGR